MIPREGVESDPAAIFGRNLAAISVIPREGVERDQTTLRFRHRRERAVIPREGVESSLGDQIVLALILVAVIP